MKASWSSACGERGRVKFTGAQKHLADGKELNTLVTSDMKKCLKMNKKSSLKDMDNSDSDNELENFNFEKFDIRADSELESEHVREERLGKYKLCTKINLYQE